MSLLHNINLATILRSLCFLDPKPISPTHVPKGLKRQGSKDETGKEKAIQEKSIHGILTQ